MTMHTTPLDSFEGANGADVMQAVPLMNCVFLRAESTILPSKQTPAFLHKMQAGISTPESIPPLQLSSCPSKLLCAVFSFIFPSSLGWTFSTLDMNEFVYCLFIISLMVHRLKGTPGIDFMSQPWAFPANHWVFWNLNVGISFLFQVQSSNFFLKAMPALMAPISHVGSPSSTLQHNFQQ